MHQTHQSKTKNQLITVPGSWLQSITFLVGNEDPPHTHTPVTFSHSSLPVPHCHTF